MNDIDLSALLEEATAAAEAAGAVLKDAYAERPQRPEFSSWADLKAEFEELDAMSAALVQKPLADAVPGAHWLEEDWQFGTELPTEGDVWVLDAVEGAIQFIHNLPQWAVSLALVRDGEVVLAVLHSPLLEETYTGLRGGGAFLNGSPIRPSVKTDLPIAFVATNTTPLMSKEPEVLAATLRATDKLMPSVLCLRNFGPTAWQIADVASGRIDAFWQFGKDPANLVAGALLVTEAGGVVSDAAGKPWRFTSDSFIAGPKSIQAQLVARLSANGSNPS